MDNTTPRSSVAIKAVTAILAVALAAAAAWLIWGKEKPAPSPEPTSTATATATSTATATASSTSTPTATQTGASDPLSGWKTYSNPLLGIEFRYPGSFLLQKESYGATAGLTATFTSQKGEISFIFGKGLTIPGTRLQTSSVNVGGKSGNLFTVRIDACDASVARAAWSNTYDVELVMKSCGDPSGIASDKSAVSSIVSSFKFSNANTALFWDADARIAFRYPTTVGTVGKSASVKSRDAILIGDEMGIEAGAWKDASGKAMTLEQLLATKTNVASQQEIKVAGGKAIRLTFVPSSGATTREIYLERSSPTDILVLRQTGVDEADLATVSGSLAIIK